MLSIWCLPDGLVIERVISGTPETFDVKAIVPFANAARGRPDGAKVTLSVSTTSAYISFEVCRTLARLQGSAGVFELDKDGALEFEKFVLRGVLLCTQSSINASHRSTPEVHAPW